MVYHRSSNSTAHREANLEIRAVAGEVTSVATKALIVNLFQGVSSPGGATGAVDAALEGAISRLIDDGEITGKKGEITTIHSLGRIPAERVIVAGLGKQDRFSADVVRQVMGEVGRYLRKISISSAATIAHGAGIGGMDPDTAGLVIAEGTLLGLYTFDRYKGSPEDGGDSDSRLEELLVVERDESKIGAIQQSIDKGKITATAAMVARDLANEPANVLTPTELAERARKLSEEAGIEFTVIEREGMQEMGMGALLAVAAGSAQPPKLIVMRYQGDPGNQENNIALCGKGITFDTGGISLKPAEGMGNMKGDMAGGASVIGAMQAVAALRPAINVMGVVPATENMPGGSATRPADVVRSLTGKTIEIDNTDAEGRLVLADAIGYARQEGAKRVVDVATLTGAAVVALGNITSAVMGNDPDTVARVIRAGEATGERFWELPLYEEYREQLNSDVADMKNTGGRPAGSITAGYFIREFAGEVPWAHLDIAGTARTDKQQGYIVKGHTGIPVRTLVALVEGLAG